MRLSYINVFVWFLALQVLICICASPPVGANEAQDVDRLMEAIREQARRIELLEQRILELEESSSQQAQLPDATLETPERVASVRGTGDLVAASPASDTSPVVSWKGGPVLTSPDDKYSLKLRGRAQADMWLVDGDPPDGNYPSGTELRSVRLGVEGRLGAVLRYKVEADFAGNAVTVKDAFIEYAGGSSWALQAGNFKPHVSLENRIGLPQTTFMERALPNLFAISDEIPGLGLTAHGRNWSLGGGGFGEGPGTHIEGNEGYGVAARFTYAPLLEEDRLIHVGASGYYKYLGKDAGPEFRLRQRPETHLFATRLLDTGAMPADSTTVIGVELAGATGPFSFQSEYLRDRVDYTDLGTAEFSGAYAYLSWVATGESRSYSASSGKFGSVRPHRALGNGGWGALEWAIRYSTLDLEDAGIFGGKGENISIGANWYLSEYVRVMFNLVHFDVEDSHATMPFGVANHEGNAFGIRTQVTW